VQMALAPALGRNVAHALLAEASRQAARERRPLFAVLGGNDQVRAVLDEAALARLLDPAHYLGASAAFVDRALAQQ
jgi:3-carboxy-cis,cis-muconate cycloisomerase